MATTRITEKISKLVSSQLPEFFRNDYQLFVSFIEAYYTYLEQDQQALELVQNALSYNDIDRTASSFVNYFLKNYAKHIPLTTALNKKFLVKRINDLYQSKGSELSFKLLFKLLYDVAVEQSHPYDFVLRPSDGIWDQRVSLRVERVDGSVNDLTDRFIFLSKNEIEYKDAILKVKNLSPNLYEVFLSSTTTTPYEINDEIVVKDEDGIVVFVGAIRPTAVDYTVSQAGAGFKAGQVFTISIAGAVDTVIRILKVNATGGIELLKILNYGYGFTGSSLSIDLRSDLTVASRTKTLVTKAGGFIETIQLTLPHTISTAGRYFLTDYVATLDYTGSLLAFKNEDNSFAQVDETGENDASTAVISFTYGAIARYPGQYLSSKGFISEPVVRLQDDKLYQPFAYQLESELDISYFYDTVRKLVHPAGTNLFNNRVIETFANIKSNVSVITRANISLELEDYFTISESVIFGYYEPLQDIETNVIDATTFNITKALADNAQPVDSLTFNVQTIYSDNVTQDDNLSLQIQLVLSDTANIIDDTSTVTNYLRTFNNQIAPFEEGILNQISLVYNDTATPEDVSVAALSLDPIQDNTAPDDSTSLLINKAESDSISTIDAEIKTIFKDINNTISNVTLTESITAQTTSYAVPGYFSELYAGSLVTLA